MILLTVDINLTIITFLTLIFIKCIHVGKVLLWFELPYCVNVSCFKYQFHSTLKNEI